MIKKLSLRKAKSTPRGVPQRDGSGGGIRINRGRGGCIVSRPVPLRR
jgi:hypothetical protein